MLMPCRTDLRNTCADIVRTSVFRDNGTGPRGDTAGLLGIPHLAELPGGRHWNGRRPSSTSEPEVQWSQEEIKY